MRELQSALTEAGFELNHGATADDIRRTATEFGVTLPERFVELWTLTDGATGDGIELLALIEVQRYGGVSADTLGYVPFTDCNDSDPYAMCCNGPLRGAIVHLFHDGDTPRLISRDLDRFLELVAEVRRVGGDVNRLNGDFPTNRPERSEEDARSARALIHAAAVMDVEEQSRQDTLCFAAQLLGVGHEADLAEVLIHGNEHVRDNVRRRWVAIGTPNALERLQADTDAYRAFVARLRQAFEDAGVRTRTDKHAEHGEFVLLPGKVGPYFGALYADRRTDVIEYWVGEFKRRLTA